MVPLSITLSDLHFRVPFRMASVHDLVKYSMTRSIARSLYDSWASCLKYTYSPWFVCASGRRRHTAAWRSRDTWQWRHGVCPTAVYRCRRTDTWTVAGAPLAPTDSTRESCLRVFWRRRQAAGSACDTAGTWTRGSPSIWAAAIISLLLHEHKIFLRISSKENFGLHTAQVETFMASASL